MKGFLVSNLLLITDVARLRKIFGKLTEDKNIRLRVVNNLEKGGEEITIEKPDVVFVQTHLSGLSPDILIMHLKKQLGRKRSRFVLLASSGQTNDAALKQYQGWLDTSTDDSQFFSDLQGILATLLNKTKKSAKAAVSESGETNISEQQPITIAEPSPLSGQPQAIQTNPPDEDNVELLQLPAVSQTEFGASLEEQGITYAPRQRLSVYSEFNSSFDSAVSNTSEPKTLDQATPVKALEFTAEEIGTIETKLSRSKRGTFLLWLAPVIIAVVVITYMQQQKPTTKPDPIKVGKQPVAAVAPSTELHPPGNISSPPTSKTVTVASVVPPAASQSQDRISDKAVMSDIAESRATKGNTSVPSTETRLTKLPDFIPRDGFDKKFSAANPGWERYKGRVTEFKLLRETTGIKAIQIIDRGGEGVPESFMKGVLRQVAKNPVFSAETSEKKEGYRIERGHVGNNIKVVYYRDEQGGKLRGFVLTWQ